MDYTSPILTDRLVYLSFMLVAMELGLCESHDTSRRWRVVEAVNEM